MQLCIPTLMMSTLNTQTQSSHEKGIPVSAIFLESVYVTPPPSDQQLF